jgi:hypothetical protein
MPSCSQNFTRLGFYANIARRGLKLLTMAPLAARYSPASFCFLITMCLISGGCASSKNTTAASSAHVAQTSDNAPPPGPDAKINISYSRPGDFLNSLTVSEYSSATTVLTESGKRQSASIIRFEGGVVVWQIGVGKRLLADIPMFGENKSYALHQVTYGKLPADFVSMVPESGPPQPLQPDHYYVFTVARASGATSYEAVKVNGDGSLEAYAAEPRAGDSFRLCCDLSPDFVVNANAMTTPAYP